MSIKKHVAGNHCIRLFLFVILMSGLLIEACTKSPTDFTLGEKYIESQTDIALIDTFSVTLSTVLLDTLVTSGTGSMLIGCYQDDVFGKITSHSYLQLGVPSTFEITNDDVYDSLSLIIRYNGYAFGDTTQAQHITVHRLTETIETASDSTISRSTTFEYDPDPIGDILYTPRPNQSDDTLFIKISDAIGMDLFQKMMDGSELFSDNESFIQYYFNGLVLVADNAYEGAVIGFRGSESAAKFILYSSRDNDEVTNEFPLEAYSKQFNNIQYDFTSTQLASLVEQKTVLSASDTEGKAFLQGGIGLAIRVDFPSFPEILLYERGLLAKAELLISPLRNSYYEFALPSGISLYQTDKQNQVGESVVSASLTIDELYNEDTAYSFDISDYLTAELADSYVDPETGLLILLDSQKSKLERLILDENGIHTKLKIYYLSY